MSRPEHFCKFRLYRYVELHIFCTKALPYLQALTSILRRTQKKGRGWMQTQFEVRGVPRSILLDAWWLGSSAEIGGGEAGPTKVGGGGWFGMQGASRRRGLSFLGLVVLADILFWRQDIGLSLAIFALALVLAAGAGLPPRKQIRGGLVCLIGVLPVVEYVQVLSLVLLSAGTGAAIVLQHASGEALPRLAARSVAFLLGLPKQWVRSFVALAWLQPRAFLRPTLDGQPMRWLKDWTFPLGGSLVFGALLLDANPLFLSLSTDVISPWPLLQRVMFWVGMALFILPILQPSLPETRLTDVPQIPLPRLGLNASSSLRALIMFNALIGVQMFSDAAILVWGAELPGGMTYAEYAHRGAYPLLATAMLAMGFALVSQPFWDGHRLIRPLMLLWLGQNIALTGAAALRLDLYIEAYGQTYLRLYALIWMGLVAFGLVLTGMQMLLNRTTSWLVTRAAAGGAITLYACAFVNFAHVIATHNLAQPKPDVEYLCDLGPMASGAFAGASSKDNVYMIDRLREVYYCKALDRPRIHGWRDWGLRSWQVNHMVETARLPGAPL